MRPKTAGERNESVMMDKARKEMEKTKDPTEKLRYFNLDIKHIRSIMTISMVHM